MSIATHEMLEEFQANPLEFGKMLWPDVELYKQQREIVHSVRDDDETFVVAGNKLGKDFVAAFVVLWFFMSRHPCRIVTTSAVDDHLRVLWGEILRFIQQSRYPLTVENGGNLIVNHREIRKTIHGQRCPTSYIIGLVANPDRAESMQGHHVAVFKPGTKALADDIPRTLFVGDEASSLYDAYYRMACTWARRKLIFGNPWHCENFFRQAVREGSVKALTYD